MRLAAWLVLGLTAACGRIGFDALGDVGDGTGDAAQGGGGSGSGSSGDVTAGLLAYYPFEDDLANGADDASGNNRTATCTGAVCPTTMPGRLGSAARFNGSTQYLEISDSGVFSSGEPFTIAMWLQMETHGGSMITKREGTSQSWDLWVGLSPGSLWFTSNNQGARFSSSTIALATWVNVAVAWDGSTVGLYMNGTQTGSFARTSIQYDTSSVMLGAGRDGSGVTYQMRGRLDEVRIYGRALSAAEIQVLSGS